MRSLILLPLLLLSFSLLAQKDECDRYFKKEKISKKATVFTESKAIETRKFALMTDGKRIIYSRLIKDEKGQRIEIIADYREGLKREIKIGQEQKIALIFADSTHQLIEFTGNPQLIQEIEGGALMADERSYANSVPLTPELYEALKTKKLAMVEIKNPFGIDWKVRTKTFDVSRGEADKINRVANCFDARQL